MTPTIAQVTEFLERFAPPALAESWDNVGLLVGDRVANVERIMTCLTITPASAAEAVAERVELIVAHHPLPFHPLKRLTTDSVEGGLLWQLARGGVSVYSAHTAFDSAREGINAMLAAGLELIDVAPLLPTTTPGKTESGSTLGAGRQGRLEKSLPLSELVERVKRFLNIERAQMVGSPQKTIRRVGIACGAADSLLDAARAAGCDCFLTGEARFHTCLAAEATNVALVLAGHYATERFAVEALSGILSRQFPGVQVWASRREQDPIRWR